MERFVAVAVVVVVARGGVVSVSTALWIVLAVEKEDLLLVY